MKANVGGAKRRLILGVAAIVSMFAIGSAYPAEAPSAPGGDAAASPASSGSAAGSPAAPEHSVSVTGFRSAQFGMTEAEVRAAISKDFGIGGNGVRVSRSGAERTAIFSIKAPDVLADGGVAEVAYIFGYKTKKLIQVSVLWSKATDEKLTPERLISNGEALRAYFASAGYKADTITENEAVRNGVLMFRGSDADSHMTVLLLTGSTAGKERKVFTPTELSLFYMADVKNPDVFRVSAGKF